MNIKLFFNKKYSNNNHWNKTKKLSGEKLVKYFNYHNNSLPKWEIKYEKNEHIIQNNILILTFLLDLFGLEYYKYIENINIDYKGKKLFFSTYIKNLNIIIDFFDYENFSIKNEYCKENKIIFINIPNDIPLNKLNIYIYSKLLEIKKN